MKEEDKLWYNTKNFTEDGYKLFKNYLVNLIKLYFSLQEYPHRMMPVLGIPLFQYSQTIKNEDELLGRIKAIGQIVGADKIEFEFDGKKGVFDMQGKFTIQ